MEVVKGFVKTLFTAQILVQAVMYLALIFIQLAYPKASVVQMIVAAVFLIVIQAIFVYSGSNRDEPLIEEKDE